MNFATASTVFNVRPSTRDRDAFFLSPKSKCTNESAALASNIFEEEVAPVLKMMQRSEERISGNSTERLAGVPG